MHRGCIQDAASVSRDFININNEYKCPQGVPLVKIAFLPCQHEWQYTKTDTLHSVEVPTESHLALVREPVRYPLPSSGQSDGDTVAPKVLHFGLLLQNSLDTCVRIGRYLVA